MFVGTLRLVIHIPAAQSLKDRRRVVNKLKDRLRSRLHVSVCELGDADRHQVATIGLVTVDRDPQACRRVLDSAKSMAETLADAWLADSNGEVLAFGEGGQNLRGGIESFPTKGIFGDESEPPRRDPPPPRPDPLDDCAPRAQSGSSGLSLKRSDGPVRLKVRIRKR